MDDGEFEIANDDNDDDDDKTTADLNMDGWQ